MNGTQFGALRAGDVLWGRFSDEVRYEVLSEPKGRRIDVRDAWTGQVREATYGELEHCRLPRKAKGR